MRRLSSLVLALALLLGQATLLAHEYDFAIHKDGASCSVCLHASPLTHAAVGGVLFTLPCATNAVVFQPIERQLTSVVDTLYNARAPPASPSF